MKRLQKPPRKKTKRQRRKVNPLAIAAAQGVKPITDVQELRGNFWPEEENLDDFLRELTRWRHEGKEEQ